MRFTPTLNLALTIALSLALACSEQPGPAADDASADDAATAEVCIEVAGFLKLSGIT